MENTIPEFGQVICNVCIKRNNVPFGLPNQWGPSHQIWSHPPAEGIGHVESDGSESYGNERNVHLQYVEVRKRKVICRDMQFGVECRKDRFKLGGEVLFDFLH
jgi:hypothetical protein